MTQPALDNLVRIGQLKTEARNEAEAKRMLAMARTRLADAQLCNLSAEGRFISAYNAAHAAALAALRWHGYRSETATSFSNACPIPSAGMPSNGAFWIAPTRNGISPSTRVFWK